MSLDISNRESQNGLVGRDLEDDPVPAPSHGQGHAALIARTLQETLRYSKSHAKDFSCEKSGDFRPVNNLGFQDKGPHDCRLFAATFQAYILPQKDLPCFNSLFYARNSVQISVIRI